MHRARVKAVSGNRVLADGSWLTCIGNHAVYPGEWIWTDGRCVYGHESNGGSSYVPTNALSGVPLIQVKWKDQKNQMLHLYYAKGKIHPLGFSPKETWMVNNGSRFAIFPRNQVLDAEMDERGNIYTIENVNVLVFPLIGADQRDGVLRVKCNGEVIAAYDLMQLFGVPNISRPIDLYSCQTAGGRVDKTGNFKVMVWRSVSLHGGGGSPTNQYMFFDGMNIEPWIEKGDTSEIRWHAPDYSIRYPLHDGMYMRFPANLKYLNSEKGYISKIYSAKDELLMELPTNPTARPCLCPVGERKYLVSTGSPLYLWKDGQLTELLRGCYNYRLRRMSNLNKWKKAGGI